MRGAPVTVFFPYQAEEEVTPYQMQLIVDIILTHVSDAFSKCSFKFGVALPEDAHSEEIDYYVVYCSPYQKPVNGDPFIPIDKIMRSDVNEFISLYEQQRGIWIYTDKNEREREDG